VSWKEATFNKEAAVEVIECAGGGVGAGGLFTTESINTKQPRDARPLGPRPAINNIN
jgi:hypothetical protein